MSALAWLQLVAALASFGAAALVWAALARTGAARDERLRDKDARIEALTREAEALRELTPLRIRDYLAGSHDQLRRCLGILEDGYRSARKEIERCNGEITRRQEQGEWRAEDIGELVARREALIEVTRAMKPELRAVQHQCDFPEAFPLKLARIDPAAVAALAGNYLALARQLPLGEAEQLQELAGRVAQSCKYRLDERTLFSASLFTAPTGAAAELWQRPDNGE
jgi:hypothetical protein